MATQPIDRQKAKSAIKQCHDRPMIQRSNKTTLRTVVPLLARLRPNYSRDWFPSHLDWWK